MTVTSIPLPHALIFFVDFLKFYFFDKILPGYLAFLHFRLDGFHTIYNFCFLLRRLLIMVLCPGFEGCFNPFDFLFPWECWRSWNEIAPGVYDDILNSFRFELEVIKAKRKRPQIFQRREKETYRLMVWDGRTQKFGLWEGPEKVGTYYNTV